MLAGHAHTGPVQRLAQALAEGVYRQGVEVLRACTGQPQGAGQVVDGTTIVWHQRAVGLKNHVHQGFASGHHFHGLVRVFHK